MIDKTPEFLFEAKFTFMDIIEGVIRNANGKDGVGGSHQKQIHGRQSLFLGGRREDQDA